MNLKESIRKILKEETEDFVTCLPLFKNFKIPKKGVVMTDIEYGTYNIDKFFWEVVDLVDYKSDNDYDRIRDMFLNLNRFCGIDSDVFIALLESFESKMGSLENRWGDDIINVSDDSWDDLKADIISRGKDFYVRAMSDFDMVQKMANDEDFEESFSYSFPMEDELS
jgi:hypothetical protein